MVILEDIQGIYVTMQQKADDMMIPALEAFDVLSNVSISVSMHATIKDRIQF